MLIDPVEARAKFGATSAYWFEMEHLTGHVGNDLVNLGVEVENMHPLRPLAFNDGTNLCLEEPQLPLSRLDLAGQGGDDYRGGQGGLGGRVGARGQFR